jgi:hypothetical protein
MTFKTNSQVGGGNFFVVLDQVVSGLASEPNSSLLGWLSYFDRHGAALYGIYKRI